MSLGQGKLAALDPIMVPEETLVLILKRRELWLSGQEAGYAKHEEYMGYNMVVVLFTGLCAQENDDI